MSDLHEGKVRNYLGETRERFQADGERVLPGGRPATYDGGRVTPAQLRSAAARLVVILEAVEELEAEAASIAIELGLEARLE